MARDFEATFLGMVLKEMRQTLDPDGGLFAGDTGDVQGGLFDLYLGQHLAAAGGVGLATAITRQLGPDSTHARPAGPPPGGPRPPA
jgi:flagellar protein FlgJ